MAACAAFTLAALLGGKRARSLTAVRLADFKMFAKEAEVGDKVVLVPTLHITFTDEKYADLRGDREARDVPHREEYARTIWYSPAFWIYRFLAVRGVLVQADPLLHACVGDELLIRPECLHYFLFCDVNNNYWIDTAPIHVHTLGNWTRKLLVRMGSAPRGLSATGQALWLALVFLHSCVPRGWS